MTVHGVPEYVLVRGRICVENETVRVAEGFGRFIPLPARSSSELELVEESVEQPLPKHEHEHEEKQNGDLSNKYAQLNIQIPAPEPISPLLAGHLSVPAEGSVCSTPSARGRVDGKRDMQESSFSISGNIWETILRVECFNCIVFLQRNWINRAYVLASRLKIRQAENLQDFGKLYHGSGISIERTNRILLASMRVYLKSN